MLQVLLSAVSQCERRPRQPLHYVVLIMHGHIMTVGRVIMGAGSRVDSPLQVCCRRGYSEPQEAGREEALGLSWQIRSPLWSSSPSSSGKGKEESLGLLEESGDLWGNLSSRGLGAWEQEPRL